MDAEFSALQDEKFWRRLVVMAARQCELLNATELYV